MYYFLSLILLNKSLKFVNIFCNPMTVIKLDAIDSTNDYLKRLSKETELDNYTVVIANEQTNGKGQMGAKWVSEKGKNLTMSMLIKDFSSRDNTIFTLNIIAALSVVDVLNTFNIPNISIKWPNDIMSDSKKVAGILIENSLKSEVSFTSVIGVGLNLNQTSFIEFPQATSLSLITSNEYEPEQIAILLKESIKERILVMTKNAEFLWKTYHENLYKLNYPSAFEDQMGNRFMGIIKRVNNDGKLEVLHEDDSMVQYEVKEIKLLY